VYEPTARPGARLPHAWTGEIRGRSTLDLVDFSSPTLISFGSHDAWATDLAEWPEVVHVKVGTDTGPLDAWRQICEVGDTGALLVRPDQHIAWRAPEHETSTPLHEALNAVSGGT
jgi:2,4-dichlorophenol 6-monooxygenase